MIGRLALPVLALLVACAEPASPPPADGGADSAAVDAMAPVVPDPPAPPIPPDLLPCPEGWTQTPGAGAGPECEPFPSGEAVLCEPGTFLGVGDAACERIGTACPADGWPVDLPSGAPIVYVDPNARGAATGTREAPHARIAEALAVIAEGGVVALRAGRYDENVMSTAVVSLVGACVNDTVIGSTSLAAPAVHVQAGHLSLTNLSIAGAAEGVTVDAGAALAATAIQVGGLGHGIRVSGAGATATLLTVVVRDVDEADTGPAAGIAALRGGSVSAAGGGVERVTGTGVLSEGEESRIEVTDFVIRDTELGSTDAAYGAAVREGGTFIARASALRRTVGSAVVVETGGSVELEDMSIHEVFSSTAALDGEVTPEHGSAVYVDTGGRATVRRASISHARTVGVRGRGDGTLITLEDVIIRDTQLRFPSLTISMGVGATRGASITGRRLAILRTSWAGLGSFLGATVDCEDVRVADMIAVGVGTSPAIRAQEGGRLTVRRAEVQNGSGSGVLAILEGSVLEATDLRIVDVRPDYFGGFGYGATVARGATASFERLSIDRSQGVGLFVANASASVTEARLLRTAEMECASHVCEGYGLGMNVSVVEGGVLAMDHFESSGPGLCGIQIASGAEVDLHDGVVRGGPIGLNLQVDGYDVDRLTERVHYADNGVNLDSSELPVPEVPGRL